MRIPPPPAPVALGTDYVDALRSWVMQRFDVALGREFGSVSTYVAATPRGDYVEVMVFLTPMRVETGGAARTEVDFEGQYDEVKKREPAIIARGQEIADDLMDVLSEAGHSVAIYVQPPKPPQGYSDDLRECVLERFRGWLAEQPQHEGVLMDALAEQFDDVVRVKLFLTRLDLVAPARQFAAALQSELQDAGHHVSIYVRSWSVDGRSEETTRTG